MSSASKLASLMGKTVKIKAVSEKSLSHFIGKTGVVTGAAPFEMVVLAGVEGAVGEYWAKTYNLKVLEG